MGRTFSISRGSSCSAGDCLSPMPGTWDRSGAGAWGKGSLSGFFGPWGCPRLPELFQPGTWAGFSRHHLPRQGPDCVLPAKGQVLDLVLSQLPGGGVRVLVCVCVRYSCTNMHKHSHAHLGRPAPRRSSPAAWQCLHHHTSWWPSGSPSPNAPELLRGLKEPYGRATFSTLEM